MSKPRVVRGGSWHSIPYYTRAAYRHMSAHVIRFSLGFRCVAGSGPRKISETLDRPECRKGAFGPMRLPCGEKEREMPILGALGNVCRDAVVLAAEREIDRKLGRWPEETILRRYEELHAIVQQAEAEFWIEHVGISESPYGFSAVTDAWKQWKES